MMHHSFSNKRTLLTGMVFLAFLSAVRMRAQTPPAIAFGNAVHAREQIRESRALAKRVASPDDPLWRARGDQHRKYHFTAADADMPYRLYVPNSWDGKFRLPLLVFLHGAGSDENWYVDANDGQLIRLAEQHGSILVSPLGYTRMGADGTPLRLPAAFGNPEIAAKQRAAVNAQQERTLELSEKDAINVMEIVLREYPVDRSAIFLAGHSMGSGGTWYLGAKYAQYRAAIAPMSGPFVGRAELSVGQDTENAHPDDGGGRRGPISRRKQGHMSAWMKERGFKPEYLEVKADHGEMIKLVPPDIFNFFDRCRSPKKQR
jgi:poly(3-hydroxybutyrate) depolymerase